MIELPEDDAPFVQQAMQELDLPGDFGDLTTDQMSLVLQRAALLKLMRCV